MKVDRDKRRNSEAKSKRTIQCFAVHVEEPFRYDNLSDHITSHRQAWNTRKHCIQRVSESKWNGKETARNRQKICKNIAMAVGKDEVSDSFT